HQLRYQDDPPTAEDFELWERAMEVVKVANLNAPLLRYRIDPSIKISAYVRQQIEGARSVRIRLLRRAGIELDSDLLELLHELGEGSCELSKVTLCRAEALFTELTHQNQDSLFFEGKAMQDVISLQHRRLLLRHRAV